MNCKIEKAEEDNKKVAEELEKIYVGKAPAAVVEESMRRRVAYINKVRAELIKETEEAKFRYYCSLCLIIRDENEYLEEWLRWHIGQGVEHFYIYDHGSKWPVREQVKELGEEISSKVTVIDWSGSHSDAQPDAYNDCLVRFRGESRWIGFVDTDEQIEVKSGQTLPQFLKKYEEYAGVFAVWVTYGACGQVKKRPGSLRERFTVPNHQCPWNDTAGKVIVQPIYMLRMVIHNGKTKDGFVIVDEHENTVNDYSMTSQHPTKDFIVVNHYYTKSYEEWLNKLKRGTAHANYHRKYSEFFYINPDMRGCWEDVTVDQQYESFQSK